MDVLHRRPFVRHAEPGQVVRRQRLRQRVGGGQRVFHTAGDLAAGQALGLGIDRHEGFALHLRLGAHDGVCHFPAGERAFRPALKVVFLAQQQLVRHEMGVEPGEGQCAGVVCGSGLHHGAAAGQAHRPLLGADLGLDDHIGAGGGFGDGAGLAVINVAARIVAEQVAHGGDAQPGEALGQLGAHALDVLNGGIRLHGGASFFV